MNRNIINLNLNNSPKNMKQENKIKVINESPSNYHKRTLASNDLDIDNGNKRFESKLITM